MGCLTGGAGTKSMAPSSSARNTQAIALKNFIQAHVPAADFLVVGGDFNTDSRHEPALSTLSPVVVTAAPYPADRNNNGNTNASRAKPYDWLLADHDLHALRTATAIGTQSFENGLVFESRTYAPLSEFAPVQSGDSGSTNMQHMAVIRDFVVPDGGSPTPLPGALTSGVAVSATLTVGSWSHYSLVVPLGSSRVTFTLSGTAGDADLYIKRATSPTTSSYDFRPYLGTSNEQVIVNATTVPALSSGTWNVSVNGYSAATFTLKAVIE